VSGEKQRVVTGGVGEWVIAVIVVGLASLIFVIAFGTTMVLYILLHSVGYIYKYLIHTSIDYIAVVCETEMYRWLLCIWGKAR
jgi:hypothetical protein